MVQECDARGDAMKYFSPAQKNVRMRECADV